MAPERKVPILKTDFSILDSEFNSIRERFEQEMRKMEDEMSKFRNELLSREQEFFNRSSSMQSSEKQLTAGGGSPWLDGIESPLIQDGNDGKQLKLRFDVSQYVPEEIVVKTVDNKLMVHAKHEEKSENRSVYREYNREFLLPKGTNPEAIKSSLSKDGILTVEAPLPAIEGPNVHMISINNK